MCEHTEFEAMCEVARLSELPDGPVTLYTCDVRVVCVECGTPFRFKGLPRGLDLYGAAMSADGLEARLAIEPAPGSSAYE